MCDCRCNQCHAVDKEAHVQYSILVCVRPHVHTTLVDTEAGLVVSFVGFASNEIHFTVRWFVEKWPVHSSREFVV